LAQLGIATVTELEVKEVLHNCHLPNMLLIYWWRKLQTYYDSGLCHLAIFGV